MSAVDRLGAHDRRPRLLVVVAGVLAVALALALWWALEVGGGDRLEQAEREATAVARERAEQLTTYTGPTFDADAAWARTGATPRFAREYAQANEPVAEVARRLDARAVGDVVDAAGRATSADEVEVLLFVDQSIVQGADGERRTERSRVVMTMVRSDGAWLVDDVALR